MLIKSQPLWDWVTERHLIYLRKQALEGEPPPRWADPMSAVLTPNKWRLDYLTDDPILAKYRFCNVFRELDRVTLWIKHNVRQPFADHPDLWLMLAIARYVNWPPTLRFLMDLRDGAWPSDPNFSPAILGLALNKRAEMKEKVYTGAYMIRAESNELAPWYKWTKHRYIAEVVIGRLWEDRAYWHDYFRTSRPGELTLEGTWSLFQDKRYIGWGPFMAYEVVTDLRHTPVLQDAPDKMTWANAGPGARRGLNRLLGVAPGNPITPSTCNALMGDLLNKALVDGPSWLGRRKFVPWGRMEMRDIEHSLCELDKYERARLGPGRPRALYVPGRGS